MTLVIDASIAAKWVLPEPDSDRAAHLRTREPDLIAPSLIIAEIGSAVWKRARLGEIDVQDAVAAVTTAISIIRTIHPIEQLIGRATEIAIELDHSIYDCFYLALAERERAPIITVDRRLSAAVMKLGTVETATF